MMYLILLNIITTSCAKPHASRASRLANVRTMFAALAIAIRSHMLSIGGFRLVRAQFRTRWSVDSHEFVGSGPLCERDVSMSRCKPVAVANA